MQYRVFAIFFVSVLPGILLSVIEPNFIMAVSLCWLPLFPDMRLTLSQWQRMTFVREASSKMYSPVVFALAQLASETPASILCSVVFFLLLYYPVGMNSDSNRAGYAFAMILITEVRLRRDTFPSAWCKRLTRDLASLPRADVCGDAWP